MFSVELRVIGLRQQQTGSLLSFVESQGHANSDNAAGGETKGTTDIKSAASTI